MKDLKYGIGRLVGGRHGDNRVKKEIRRVIKSMAREDRHKNRYELKQWDYDQKYQNTRYKDQLERQYQIKTLPRDISRAEASGDPRYATKLKERLKYNQRYVDRYLRERNTTLKRQRYKMVKNQEIAERNKRETMTRNAYKQIEQTRAQIRERERTNQAIHTDSNVKAPQQRGQFGPKRSDLGQPRGRQGR